MTFVNDDQIEKPRREFPEQLLALFRACNGLIKAEIHLIGRVNTTFFVQRRGELDLVAILALDGFSARAELSHCRAKGPEIIDHCLIDEHVAVGKKEEAFLASSLPQPPDNLK